MTTPPSTVLPGISLMIIGAQKAGTTSMKNYLGQHPLLETHPHKEFSYFFDADDFAKGYEHAYKKYFTPGGPEIKLVAKNAGLYTSEEGIKRLKQHNPGCKLIFILRNPVDRSYSSYLMERNYGAVNGTFDNIEKLIRHPDESNWQYNFFIEMGLYCKYLSMIYRYFPKEQVKLIRYEDFNKSAGDVCQSVFQWMNIDASFLPDTHTRFNVTHVNRSPFYGKFIVQLLSNHNPVKRLARNFMPGKMDYKVGEMLRNLNKTTKTYAAISPKMIEALSGFYAPHNEKLSELTGMDFSDWNKF
jgi:hypothetical protein